MLFIFCNANLWRIEEKKLEVVQEMKLVMDMCAQFDELMAF
jgi:hypothetical protein